MILNVELLGFGTRLLAEDDGESSGSGSGFDSIFEGYEEAKGVDQPPADESKLSGDPKVEPDPVVDDETPKGDEDEVAPGDSKVPPKSQRAEWITDDVVRHAKQMGLSEDDIGTFQSADEFRRAAWLAQRQMQAGRERFEAEERSRREYEAARRAELEKNPLPKHPLQVMAENIQKAREEGESEALIAALQSQHDAMLFTLQQSDHWRRQAEYSQQQIQNQRDSATLDLLDSLGLPDVFGTQFESTTEQKQQTQRAHQVFTAMVNAGASFDIETMRSAVAAIGGPSLASRARLTSGASPEDRDKARRVVSQSKSKMGSGGRAQGRDSSPADDDSRADPGLLGLFQKLKDDPSYRLTKREIARGRPG